MRAAFLSSSMLVVSWEVFRQVEQCQLRSSSVSLVLGGNKMNRNVAEDGKVVTDVLMGVSDEQLD